MSRGSASRATRPVARASDHTLIFDETYYVNAARVIAGVRMPSGERYAGTPAGDDPNSEHPQLAKLIIAGSIELFGDGPLAWRLGSLLCGSLAILGMYALARAVGGGRWLALGAGTLMALDNLLLVHSRIGTLDVYVLAAMLWGVALYLRARPLVAGAILGVGACVKLVAPYALLVLALIELLRWLAGWRSGSWTPRLALGRFAACTATALVVFFAGLEILDLIAPPYDPNTHTLISGGAFAHLAHMLSYSAAQVTGRGGPQGIASYPWQWLGDYKPIVYLNVEPGNPAAGLQGIRPAVHFLGVVSPPILALALPALAFGAWSVVRARSAPGGEALAARRAGVTGSGRLRAGSAGADEDRGRDPLARLVPRHVPAVRGAQPADESYELSVLHGDRDAGNLRGRGLPDRARAPPALAARNLVRIGPDRRDRDVPVHAAALAARSRAKAHRRPAHGSAESEVSEGTLPSEINCCSGLGSGCR